MPKGRQNLRSRNKDDREVVCVEGKSPGSSLDQVQGPASNFGPSVQEIH